jgi:anti-sigma regulatory factor (Ser/Thr protein kinase)
VDDRSGESPAPFAVSGPGLDVHARRFRHTATVVDSDRALLDTALPFLDEGLSVGDLVLLSLPRETDELLRRELGPAAASIGFDTGVTLMGARAPDVFAHYRRLLGEGATGVTRLRVVAQPFGLDDEQRRREQMRVESAANQVLAELPISTMCVYDSRRLPAELVASAAATHPELAAGRTVTASPDYRDPESYVRGLPRPREAVEDREPLLVVDEARSLADLRHALAGALAPLVDDEVQLEDLRLGVSEVAANAFRHGTRPVSARMWTDGARLVCEISDSGRGFDDPLAGFIPAHGFDLSAGGMGLWLARKLFDSVDLLSERGGLTVRLSTRIR